MQIRNLSCVVLVPAALWSCQLMAQSSTDGWHVFEKCPVLVEKEVEVPAWQSGVLTTVDVERNQAVGEGATIASLDTELPRMEMRIAQLQLDVAKRLAEDNSDIQYHEVALEYAETELANFKKIGSSVGGAELRRAELSVAQAKQALIRAQQAKARAEAEASLKHASVEAASIRLKRCQVKAPLQGVVSDVLRSEGQWVEAGQTICKIKNLDHLVVDVMVPLRAVDLSTIVGSPVRVEIPNRGGSPALLSGSITSYDSEVSSQGLVRVHARVANIQQRGTWSLLPGNYVNLYVSTEHIDRGYLSENTSSVPGRYISKPR